MILQPAVCLLVLGNHDQAGGLLVQPVDDAGAFIPPDAFQVRDMSKGGMDQRAAVMTG